MTVEILLTRGYVAIVDDEDADLADVRWFAVEHGRNIYAVRYVRNESKIGNIYLHRVILELKLGRKLQPGEMTDHEDGDGLNNRRSNLRLSDRTRNRVNQRNAAPRKNGFPPGVYLSNSGRRYTARMGYRTDGKFATHHLGTFDTIDDAHAVFKAAHVERYGEFSPYFANGESDARQKISLDKEPPRLRSASPEGDVEDVGGENLEQYETAVTSQEIGVRS